MIKEEFDKAKQENYKTRMKGAIKYLRRTGMLEVLSNEKEYFAYTSYLLFENGKINRKTLKRSDKTVKYEYVGFAELKRIFNNGEVM